MLAKAMAAGVAAVLGASLLVGCGTYEDDGCRWEQEKRKGTTVVTPKSFMGKGGPGGSRGGGSRGGGSRPNFNKPAPKPNAPANKPRYTKVNPAPKPTNPPKSGHYWEWDCD